MDVVVLAQSVLDCPDEAVLQLLSLAPELPVVTIETSVADARRNYIRLAGILHPDKLKNRFEKATEVFQKLVRAFEKVADPKYRKTLQAQKAKEEKQKNKRKTVEGGVKKAKPKQLVEVAARGTTHTSTLQKQEAVKKIIPQRTKPIVEDDFVLRDDEGDMSSDKDEDTNGEDTADSDAGNEDFMFLASAVPPSVSTNRALIGTPRVGGIYNRTVVRCPQCRTSWEPDSKQHYTLFMGPAGKKVHCETCLCRFGCATALHACPNCQRGFDYDVTMYDTEVKCGSCKKAFGFPYYPVNQHLIDLVGLEEWRERAEREKAVERTQRAARRRAGESDAQDELHTLVGTCIVEEQCPICKKAVVSRHRQHVEACLKISPADRKASQSKPSRSGGPGKPTLKPSVSKSSISKKAPTTSGSAKKAPTKRVVKPVKKAGKKRPRRGSSDSNSEEEEEEEEPSFEETSSDDDD
ncbi:hypothetical protein, conserved [Trypanosoma brucei brucei TREU927]|uniref:J domain-containing protein n=1 Tax=Trypanosoma brucei brucei (strain 927/4 GUTat10.1) TaxID=185431 RepID=Q38FZ1_TRYB2|nr:hypothetical protein, conserved [Trypanosoma brucei brucei TREU927]EAN76279.1 hypothetical protein, conserved [Trypanosoma brucei brucei TREU927]